MQCQEVQELLSPFLDGMLEDLQEQGVSAHLAVCTDCRKEWYDLMEAVNSLKALPEMVPPANLSSGVRNELNHMQQAVWKRNGIVRQSSRNRWVAFAAAVVLVVGLTALAYGAGGHRSLRSFLPGFAVKEPAVVAGNGLDRQKDEPVPLASDKDSRTQDAGNTPVERAASNDSETPVSSRDRQALTSKSDNKSKEVSGARSDLTEQAAESPETSRKNTAMMVETVPQESSTILEDGSPKLLSKAVLKFAAGVSTNELAVLARNSGGYVSDEPGGKIVTMRIPSKKLSQTIGSLQGMGAAVQSISEVDVTDDYYDLKARLRNLTVEEQHLLAVINSAGTADDVQGAEGQLAKVRSEIKSSEESVNNLVDQIRFATIKIYLE
jgi:hypothetical protein